MRTCDLADVFDEAALPILPCLSWLWLDVGRLTGRPALDAGLVGFWTVVGGLFGAVFAPTCNEAMFSERCFSSNPLKLRLLYRLAGSNPAARAAVSSALLARLCPDLTEGGISRPLNAAACGSVAEVLAEVERWVGVVAPVLALLDESVLPGTRL